jgi:hypothetical protein
MLAFPSAGYNPPYSAKCAPRRAAEECVEAWAAQKGEISKGLRDLKELVITQKKAQIQKFHPCKKRDRDNVAFCRQVLVEGLKCELDQHLTFECALRHLSSRRISANVV